jgi:RNA polymerase sigma-70 factor (ECF subfamily)
VDPREERFRRLYDTGRHRVIAYAMRRTSNHEDTADAVAETFAIAWRRIDDIPSGEREVPWLFAVARRVIANRLRGNSSQSAIVQRLAHQLALSAPGQDEPNSDRLSAITALSRLSEEDREILMLVAWDGLSSQELGWMFSCSPTAARIRLHRARGRLNDEWADGRLAAPNASKQLQEAPEL